MNAYDFGAVVRLSVDFTDAAGTPTDPTTVTLKVEKPDGTVTTYTDAVDDGAGLFHRDIIASTQGTWHWRWEGTGTVAQIDEGEFYIRRSGVI